MNFIDVLRTQYKSLAPDWIREAVLLRRRAPQYLQAKVVFVHIPKAAGSSINQAIYGQFMGHFKAQSVLSYGSRALSQLPRFAVTRNPWDRLVSAWRFARQGRGTGGVTAGILRPDQYSHATFNTFGTFVKDWLCEQQKSSLDGVFRPQSDYVLDATGKRLVDHLGAVESLHETEVWLSNLLGKSIVFPHNNRSGDSVDYREFYDDNLIELVAGIYDRDVSVFGYKFE